MSHFRRISPTATLFAILIWAESKGFAWEVARGGSPIPRDLYGDAVYAIPALTWCYMQEAVALLAAVASAVPYFAEIILPAQPQPLPRAVRFAAGFAVLAWVALAGVFGLFAVLASTAPQGSLVFWLSATVGLPFTAYFAITAARHTIWGDRS